MKTHHFLAALLLIMFLTVNFTFAQNEIERYKLPKVIEGSNLIISASPFYNNIYYNDTNNYNLLYLSLGADFTKWRFTPKIDYSLHFKPVFSLNRHEINENSYKEVSTVTHGNLFIEGGLSYYPFKLPVYGGFYLSTQSQYSNKTKPGSDNNLYSYLGYGRLENAGQVIYAVNFENVLLNEGIITKKLPYNIIKQLTILLDKRRNSEFYSKYKDDADIEFFSQIEEVLINGKVVRSPLDSRTVLKLYQALTNYSYVNYPRYEGWLAQAELGFTDINRNYDYGPIKQNNLTLLLSGLYGLPVGLNTNFVFTCYAGFPVNKQSKIPGSYEIFHSPITLRENFYIYSLVNLDLNRYMEYDYYTGVKVIAFYNLSSTAGISGFCNFNFGKTPNNDDIYTIDTYLNFKYNILSKLQLNAYAGLWKSKHGKTDFSSGIEFNYIVF